MSSLIDKLDKTEQSKNDIKTAINNKGGNITESTLFSEYASAIEALEVLTSTMQNNINSLNNSGDTYDAKLATAITNITSYLNTLNSYIDPDYSPTNTNLMVKLNDLNSRLNTQLSNLRTAIINKDSGVSITSPYNLDKIITGINNIESTVVNSSIGSSAQSALMNIDDTNDFTNVDEAYTWANSCLSRLKSAYSYLYRAVNGTSSTYYSYPLDDSLYSLASEVYSLGVGGGGDTLLTLVGSSSSYSSSITVPSLSSYDNCFLVWFSGSANANTGNGDLITGVRITSSTKSYTALKYSGQTAYTGSLTVSGTTVRASGSGWFGGMYYALMCNDN